MERIIDISQSAASLSVRYDQLIIRSNGAEEQVPLDEIAVLIVAHPAVVYTQAVLSGLTTRGGAFLVCDERHLPSGMLLPLQSHFLQSERLALQVEATVPLKKQVWKQIVEAKVRAQAALLQTHNGDDGGLTVLSRRVTSGDVHNIESQAAQRYWPLLLGDAFVRRPQGTDGVNSMLNYGYAVLRAIVARAICAVGLHPSLGVHHHNRYDAFCLANDIMEPFRPIVDRCVVAAVDLWGFDLNLNRESKYDLIAALVRLRYLFDDQERTLPDWIGLVADSLAAVYLKRRKKLFIPEFEHAKKKSQDDPSASAPF